MPITNSATVESISGAPTIAPTPTALWAAGGFAAGQQRDGGYERLRQGSSDRGKDTSDCGLGNL